MLRIAILVVVCAVAVCSLAASEGPIPDEEYLVLSALFADANDPLYLFGQASQVRLQQDLISILGYITAEQRSCLSGPGPARLLLRETLEDLVSKRSADLEPNLQIRVPYDLVSERYRRPPQRHQYCPGNVEERIDSVSRVGFDRAKSQALLVYSPGGYAEYVILEKLHGRWTVTCRVLQWIS